MSTTPDVPPPPALTDVTLHPAAPSPRTGALGMAVLCIVAVAGQAAGLRGLVQYGSEREGWNAQKDQFANVRSEWDQISHQFNEDATRLKSQRDTLAAEVVTLEDDRKRLADDLANIRGQYDSLAKFRDDAVKSQLRAQRLQEAAEEAEQAAKSRVSQVNAEKALLDKDLMQLTATRDSLQLAQKANKSTVDTQTSTLTKQSQELAILDARIAASRDSLRKQNEEIVAASEDLAKVLKDKQTALTAVANAVDEKDRVEKLSTAVAGLTGMATALKAEKEMLQVELAKEETRLQNAKLKLADYLEQWKNREVITKEVQKLDEQVTRLKADKESTDTKIADLQKQQKTLEAEVLTKSQDLAELMRRVEVLRTEDNRLTAAVVQKVKSLKADEPLAKPVEPIPQNSAKPE